jgi:curved DNA-binding protein CbpA
LAIHLSLYDILDLQPYASTDAIKSAFRKSALQNHPDRNDDPESTARFRVIYNAYSTLSDPAKRREYDVYLRTSVAFGATSDQRGESKAIRQRRKILGASNTLETLLGHLNYVLWDIEDLIRSQPDWTRTYSGISLRGYVLQMLTFIDKWILSPAGFPDYFFRARGMTTPANTGMLSMEQTGGHRPFVNMDDYFYNIRVRMDKVLKRAKLIELLEPQAGSGVRIIDCVFEAHNLCVHYLAGLKSALAGEGDSISQFRHTDPCFDG